jgi:predicted transcriptional regulator
MPDATVKKATTVRIDPAVKKRLLKLSTILHQSLNKLTNEALNEFIDSRFLQVERKLESSLQDLRSYRKSDPGFKRAIAEVAKAEAALKHDPIEGKIVTNLSRADKKALGIIE